MERQRDNWSVRECLPTVEHGLTWCEGTHTSVPATSWP